jgi:Fe-S-cluster containining protein
MDFCEEIDSSIRTLQALIKLVPAGGLKNQKLVQQEMDEMISPEFEPYFSANAALHLLAECERCGRCCREENTIAVSIEDSRRIARHLGLSQKRFMRDYTRPHELKADLVGSARMLKKRVDVSCLFYDPDLPGCQIHSVKPQVCRAAYYLSKMNLMLCEEQKRIGEIPGCPADAKLRARLAEFRELLDEDPRAQDKLEALFSSGGEEVEVFLLFLRLKGMEIYFGQEKAEMLARRLGLVRIPGDDEMKGAARLYVVSLMCRRKLQIIK